MRTLTRLSVLKMALLTTTLWSLLRILKLRALRSRLEAWTGKEIEWVGTVGMDDTYDLKLRGIALAGKQSSIYHGFYKLHMFLVYILNEYSPKTVHR